MGDLLDDYDPGDFFDEVVDADGHVRPHYRALVDRLATVAPADLERRERVRDSIFRTQGITFTVYGDDDGVERTFPMDLIPRIIPADEWDVVERGVVQRVTALNRFLEDLYAGEAAAINDGVVPRWLVESAAGYERNATGVSVPFEARCLVAGVDLVRDDEGTYRVLEDNLRNPSGISYVLENRAAMTRVLPVAFAHHRVRPVDHYGQLLVRALRSVAPPSAGETPCAVVLTPGVFNSAYYEHAFLARLMGIELVEGRDLVVDEHVVYMRTTRGMRRVDVIYRRIDDDFLDPLAFRPDSALGVPGLMAAYQSGNVTLANAVGTGVADDKAVYSYMPDIVKFFLGEEPILKNVPTWRCREEEHLSYVLDNIEQLVVKEVHGSGGYGMLIGPAADKASIATFRAKLKAAPKNF
ncbi:MAG: circularly permuted type 2 ATP-grasp protein, partial [Actinomycetes bacterium]